jgi:hypothetical protein
MQRRSSENIFALGRVPNLVCSDSTWGYTIGTRELYPPKAVVCLLNKISFTPG